MPDQSVFDALCDRMMGSDEDDERENWMSEQERREFFDVHLPTMADYALQLKSLKPVRGLHYSLQQQSNSSGSFFYFLSPLACCFIIQAYRTFNDCLPRGGPRPLMSLKKSRVFFAAPVFPIVGASLERNWRAGATFAKFDSPRTAESLLIKSDRCRPMRKRRRG